jgi:hypothetical protein
VLKFEHVNSDQWGYVRSINSQPNVRKIISYNRSLIKVERQYTEKYNYLTNQHSVKLYIEVINHKIIVNIVHLVIAGLFL